MKKKTDIEKIKEIAKCFLFQDVGENEFSPIIVSHPVFTAATVPIKRENAVEFVNILESPENLQRVREFYVELIENLTKVEQIIFNVICKGYRLAFFKYAYEYLSVEDRSKLLLKIWVNAENPNSDVNVPLSEAVKWFRNSNKELLMDEEDFKVYESFPEKVTLYRGITKSGNPYGLSWTTNLDTAKWFANRFGDNGNYVLAAEVKKEDILAYFTGRNENEVVVDTSNIIFKKLVDN